MRHAPKARHSRAMAKTHVGASLLYTSSNTRRSPLTAKALLAYPSTLFLLSLTVMTCCVVSSSISSSNLVGSVEDNGGGVLAGKAPEKDWWKPSNLVDTLNDDSSNKPLKITFNTPAKNWTDAIPIGNGRLGAMIWGGVQSEVLQINEDTLWTGTPGEYANPNAPEALTEVRKLVYDRKYPEATVAAVKLSGNPSDVYQLIGDIKLEFDDSHLEYSEESYHRELDLDTATARVKYSVGDVEFTREHFASNPDQVFVTRISASKSQSVSFTVCLDSKLHHNSHANGKNQIIIEGSCPGNRVPPRVSEKGKNSNGTSAEDKSASDHPKGIQFSAVLDVQISNGSGIIHVLDEKKLRIEASDWAVLRLVASSSFDGPFIQPKDSKRDPSSESHIALQSIRNFSYSDLYAHHLNDYQNLFHRVSLQLSKSATSVLGEASSKNADNTTSTATRIKSFQTDEDPSLVELLFQYGRYLLISSSRPGTQVANLQGIWNKDKEPAWDGAPHLNINLQMNYWPSLPCNLQECQEPLFDFISSLAVNGGKTAKVNYNASGWVAHQVSDLWAKTSPDRGEAVWALWPMGGAWLCTHLWEHYTYTMDKDFLKNKAYPLLEGCASFLLDWLIESPSGLLETNPSTSPEHMFFAPDGKLASVSYSSTMDMSIIKEVFSAIVSAAEVLGQSDDIIRRVVATQAKILPTKITRDGSIMEWAEDFKDPDVHHRHLSHLFGLFPGHTITPRETPELCNAANSTLYKRGEEGPGWSTTWKIALWARLGSSEHAYRMVKHLINLVDPYHEGNYEGGLYSNLFSAHPPFQIDANFGFSAAVAEMLVQSTTKDLYLLPALPRDQWPDGCVKGLKARGGLTVNICWRGGDLHEAGIWSKDQNSSVRLHYRGSTVSAKLTYGMVYIFNRQLMCSRTHPLNEVN